MSDASPNAGDNVFDLRKIRRLAELMNEHDLGEIDLQQAETRLRLRRRTESTVAVPAPGVPAAAANLAPQTSAADASTPPSDEPDESHVHLITSPMVGTFYTSSSPETPPYVQVGDHVGVDATVCIVEAMKVFNEIPAGVSGKVIAVLVENGQPVEYGQPLFKVDTRH